MGKENSWKLSFRSYESSDRLNEADRDLWNEAVDAMGSSYSPYSSFPVGAALRLDDGTIVKGSNQENVAFPSGMCAERVVVWKAMSEFPERKGEAIALCAAKAEPDELVSPCGACRQVMNEFEEKAGGAVRVLFPGGKGRVIELEKVSDLLPFPFGISSLRQGDP